MYEASSEQVEWHLLGLLNFEIAKLRSRANTHYIAGDYLKAFASLEAMEQTSCHLFEGKEAVVLREKKKNLRLLALAVQYKGSFNTEVSKKAAEMELKLKELYDDYNTYLHHTLDKYGLFGGRKLDATKMNI